MKQFTYKQGQLIQPIYKRNLGIINMYLKNKEVNNLNRWLVKKSDYIINIDSKINQAIEFSALAYAIKCYKEIAEPDLHRMLDRWISNITTFADNELTNTYKEKFNEYMGVR